MQVAKQKYPFWRLNNVSPSGLSCRSDGYFAPHGKPELLVGREGIDHLRAFHPATPDASVFVKRERDYLQLAFSASKRRIASKMFTPNYAPRINMEDC